MAIEDSSRVEENTTFASGREENTTFASGRDERPIPQDTDRSARRSKQAASQDSGITRGSLADTRTALKSPGDSMTCRLPSYNEKAFVSAVSRC
jgi:hypothetical protein